MVSDRPQGKAGRPRRPPQIARHLACPGSIRRASWTHAHSGHPDAPPGRRAAWPPSPLPGCSLRGRDDEAGTPGEPQQHRLARQLVQRMPRSSVRAARDAVSMGAERPDEWCTRVRLRPGTRLRRSRRWAAEGVPRVRQHERGASGGHPVRGKGQKPRA